MFKYRIISFPLLLALLAAIVFWPTGGPWLFTAVATLMAAGVCFETAQMLGGMGMRTEPLSTAFEGGSLFCLFNLFWMLMMNCSDLFLDGGETGLRFRELLAVKFLAFPAILIFLGWFGLLLFSKKQLFLERWLLSLAVQVAVLFPLALLTAVYWKCGIVTFAALVLITKAMDTGGYIFGDASGPAPAGGKPQDSAENQPEEIVGRNRRRSALLGRRRPALLALGKRRRVSAWLVDRRRNRARPGQLCRRSDRIRPEADRRGQGLRTHHPGHGRSFRRAGQFHLQRHVVLGTLRGGPGGRLNFKLRRKSWKTEFWLC